jgi:hypothetical protein
MEGTIKNHCSRLKEDKSTIRLKKKKKMKSHLLYVCLDFKPPSVTGRSQAQTSVSYKLHLPASL